MNEGKYLIIPISDTGREMCFSVGISGFYQDVPKSHANDIAESIAKATGYAVEEIEMLEEDE